MIPLFQKIKLAVNLESLSCNHILLLQAFRDIDTSFLLQAFRKIDSGEELGVI